MDYRAILNYLDGIQDPYRAQGTPGECGIDIGYFHFHNFVIHTDYKHNAFN